MEFRGAEATVRIEENVTKTREAKSYRHADLDERIRRERTKKEMKLMKEARKHGASVPGVEKADENILELEKIDGEQLREVLENNIDAMEQLGWNTARLHNGGIIHGDLTTRNAILAEDLYLIDFGLAERSEKIEDMAVDIHLLKQVLESSHPEVSEKAWKSFLEGYESCDKYEQVLERLEEVEKRGRYK